MEVLKIRALVTVKWENDQVSIRERKEHLYGALFFIAFLLSLWHGELATAVLLVVEVVFAEELVATVLKPAFTPVLSPKGDWGFGGGDRLGGRFACNGYLVKTLPSGGGESGGEVFYAKTLRLARRLQEAKAETELAAASTLWLLLQSLYGREPSAVVVVGVYPSYAKALCVAFALVLAYLVFLKWEDVGIIIKYSEILIKNTAQGGKVVLRDESEIRSGHGADVGG